MGSCEIVMGDVGRMSPVAVALVESRVLVQTVTTAGRAWAWWESVVTARRPGLLTLWNTSPPLRSGLRSSTRR